MTVLIERPTSKRSGNDETVMAAIVVRPQNLSQVKKRLEKLLQKSLRSVMIRQRHIEVVRIDVH